MTESYVRELTDVFSVDRLEAYRPPGGDDIAMLATYFWNVALCQSLYATLGALEVAVRNALHRTLTAYVGQPDWYDQQSLLLTREQRDINTAKKSIIDARKAILPGRVIAALPFGFWTSLLDAAYGESPKGPMLWTQTNGVLAQAFPHAPTYYQNYRGRIHRRLDDTRRLRNRVFHHEPIWAGLSIPPRRKQPLRHISLADLHSTVVTTIGWISPTAQSTVELFDTFPRVLSDGYQDVEQILNRYLQSR